MSISDVVKRLFKKPEADPKAGMVSHEHLVKAGYAVYKSNPDFMIHDDGSIYIKQYHDRKTGQDYYKKLEI